MKASHHLFLKHTSPQQTLPEKGITLPKFDKMWARSLQRHTEKCLNYLIPLLWIFWAKFFLRRPWLSDLLSKNIHFRSESQAAVPLLVSHSQTQTACKLGYAALPLHGARCCTPAFCSGDSLSSVELRSDGWVQNLTEQVLMKFNTVFGQPQWPPLDSWRNYYIPQETI